MKRIVKAFISAWINGNIIIRFPTALELSKKTPLHIPFPVDHTVSAELKIKEYYVDLLLICVGIKPATIKEQEKAIAEIFKMLLMFRSANRIEGKIFTNDLEKRVEQLEKTTRFISEIIEQIPASLFKEKKKSRTHTETAKKRVKA
ncbi:MAG: hypothetical protein QXU99_04485 [Candidatus Bathyarchaeia archaeon]